MAILVLLGFIVFGATGVREVPVPAIMGHSSQLLN